MEGMTIMHKYTMNQYNFYPLHEETVCINKYLNISPLNHQSRQQTRMRHSSYLIFCWTTVMRWQCPLSQLISCMFQYNVNL